MLKKIKATLFATTLFCCSYAQNLPLTAGHSNPLTGDLYFTGNRTIYWDSDYYISTAPSTGNQVFNALSHIFNGTITGKTANFSGSTGTSSYSPQEDLLHVGGNELGGINGYAGLKLGGLGGNRYYTFVRAVKTNGYGNFWNTALTFGVTRTNTEATIDEAMRITSDGNVAIGTTDPKGYKLAIAGKVRASEVKVEALPWPDFVFDNEYQLPALKTIEKFIKVNKHLPEIPSAKQVEEEGMELGKMNALLLKKIEELTLYLIQQNKRIEELEKLQKR